MTAADVSVRIAWPADAEGIAELLLHSWYGDGLAAHLQAQGLTATDLAAAERQALSGPPEARFRTLVALEEGRVVGLARTGPSTDRDATEGTDGEILEFLVDGDATGRGHGSRLLQAAADTLLADHFERAVHWVRTVDDDVRAFFESAGWAPDGASRELAPEAADAVPLRQVRLHTALR